MRNVPIFAKLDYNDIQELSRLAVLRDWEADTSIVFQGEPSDSLYLLLKGSVKVTETTEDGQPKILGILEQGEIFGELAMLDGQPRSATVTTCEPSETASIAQHDFRHFTVLHPEVLWNVMQALCDRIRKTSTGLLQVTYRDVPHRLLAAITELAERHGKTRPDGSCQITIKVTTQDLSAMVGTQPAEIRRLLHRYEDQGLLQLQDEGLIIRDRVALARATEFASQW